MKVAHISTVHSPFDGRIFHKECLSLAKAGHEVHLIIQHSKNETIDGVEIHALPTFPSRLQRIIVGNKLALTKALEINAEVYHFHDPELIPIGLKLKRKGYKVVFDMHELVGLMIKGKSWIPMPFRWFMGEIYGWFEAKAFRILDNVVVVTEKMVLDYTSVVYPQYKNKVQLIRNYPLVGNINDAEPIQVEKKGKTILIYVGGLTRERGVKEVINVIQDIDQVGLWLLGPWESEEFHEECTSVDLKNKLEYFGVKPLPEVYRYIRSADIGLTILNPTVNHLASLPVKAFEYMAASKPQIMSDFPFWKESFKDAVVYANPLDSSDISVKIQELASNPSKRKILGERSFNLVRNSYSWEKEQEKLLKMYESLNTN